MERPQDIYQVQLQKEGDDRWYNRLFLAETLEEAKAFMEGLKQDMACYKQDKELAEKMPNFPHLVNATAWRIIDTRTGTVVWQSDAQAPD